MLSGKLDMPWDETRASVTNKLRDCVRKAHRIAVEVGHDARSVLQAERRALKEKP